AGQSGWEEWWAVLVTDNEVAVVSGIIQLALRTKQQCAGRVIELSCADRAGAVSDRGSQIIDGYAASPHGGRIGLDPDRRFRAEYANTAHAAQNADPLAHLRAGIVVELSRGHRVADQRNVHDRLVIGVSLGKRRRRRQVDRQTAGCP